MNFSHVHIQKRTHTKKKSQRANGERLLSDGFRQPLHAQMTPEARRDPGGGETKGHGGERRASHPDYAQIPPPRRPPSIHP